MEILPINLDEHRIKMQNEFEPQDFSISMIRAESKWILFAMIILFPILCIRARSWGMLAAEVVFTICILIVSVLDLRYGMIFDKFLLPMGILAIGFSLAGFIIPFHRGIIAAILGYLLLFIVRMVSSGGLGGGDVKFAFVLGLWLGGKGLIVALFLAFTVGTVASLIFALKFRSLKIAIPFAPFLSLGAELAFLYQRELIEIYRSFW